MPLDKWLLFMTTTFFVSAAPGPNMLLSMTHGIQYGIRATTMTCLGLMSGLLLYILLSAAGLGALLATSPYLFTALTYLGAAYLVYLGIRAWQTSPAGTQISVSTGRPGVAQRFRHGFLVALSNPKAIVFFTAFFPQFIDPHLPHLQQLIILVATFYLIEASWQFAYASGGARLASWLQSLPHLRLINRITGSAFILAGIVLIGVSHH